MQGIALVKDVVVHLPDEYKFQLLALLIFMLGALWTIRYLGRLAYTRARNAVNGRVTHKDISEAIKDHRDTCPVGETVKGLDGKFDTFIDGLTGETGTLTIMLHKLECLEEKTLAVRRRPKKTTRRR